MKKYFNIFVIFFLFSYLIPHIASAQVVRVPDANLAKALRDALRLAPNAPITRQEMQNLRVLNASNRQIKDLTGLVHAKQLEELYLHENQIRGINPLAGLRELRLLTLWINQIRDIKPLAGLTQLVALELGGNQIQNVSPLAELTQLKDLGLSSNQISNTGPLRRLTQLTRLNLYGNEIRDVNPLARLTQLVSLDLQSNQISDVSPLAGLTNLEKLYLARNLITDTAPLASLTNLITVDIAVPRPTSVVQVESPEHPPMYWVNTNTGTLHRLVRAEMENFVPNVRSVTSLAVDVVNEKLYWTEKTGNTTGRIRSANLDGTNVQLVTNLSSVPHGIAPDAAVGKIYLTNNWGKIQRLNVDGSNLQPNLITGLDMPRGLALDVVSGKVYWTEAGRIRRANLDGSSVQNVAMGLSNPINIVISDNRVYWTQKTGANTGEIRFANLRGQPNVRVRHSFSQDSPVGIAVDAVENTLYWTTSRGHIGRSSLDGSTSQLNFATGLVAPGAFALSIETEVSAVSGAVVSISPSPAISPAIGEQLTLNLNITAGEAVVGYQATVQFDPTALRYIDGSNGDYLPLGAFVVPPAVNRNRVKLVSAALIGANNGDGTLATLTFEVIAAKASTLRLSDVLLADNKGDIFSPQVEGGQVTEPIPEPIIEPTRLAEDTNNDGMVNIQDLVLVAANFGKTGQNTADVNEDEIVDIRDLVKVAGAFGNAIAAPSLHPQLFETLTAEEVRWWLLQAHHLSPTDATSQRGIRFLEQLLAALIPKETALLPNYPNPFNPETWIPYHLAKPTDVTLTIYAVNGEVIQRLVLGHQLAGVYQSKSRAAYWDGRNNLGERVASGVYFYQLQTDEISSIRKMVILK